MSVTQKTTAQIDALIIAQLELSLGQTIPFLPKSFTRVLAKTLAGVWVLLYKYGGFIFLQMFVSTASIRETTVNGKTFIPLVELGRLVGAGDPTLATQAELIVDVTVTNQVGTLAGSQGVNADNGVTYLQIGSVLLDAAVKQITFRAVADQAGGDGSGAQGNLQPGDVISFANPLPNVDRDTVVDSQLTTGANGEDLDTVYRQRVLDRFQKRPQGGAYADYEQWAEEVPGIINAYPYTSIFPGQVNVYSEATVASSGDPDGIPTVAQLQAVFDSIELNALGLATRRPATALTVSLPITRTGFDVEIVGLVVSDPPATQADLTAAVEEYFLGRAPFIVGVSVPPRTDRIFQTSVSGIVTLIVESAGGTFSNVVLKIGGGVVNSYILGEGEKAKAATVVYI